MVAMIHRHRYLSRAREDRGAAAVEFGLLLVPLVLILFGIAEFSRAYNAKISLSAAAREGARVMAIEKDQDAARDAVIDAAPSLWDPNNPPSELTISFVPSTGCPPDQAIEVKVKYPVQYNIPMFRTGTFQLEGIGVMRCGG